MIFSEINERYLSDRQCKTPGSFVAILMFQFIAQKRRLCCSVVHLNRKVNLLVDLGQAFYFSIKNQCIFVFMLMRDAHLKQWIPCIIRISIFGAVLAGKKCILYTGKYGSRKHFTSKM